jgi:cytochrome c oxidase cbb3-type subunit 1
LLGVFLSLRTVAGYVHFSEASIAYSHLGLYAFYTMIMFGSMYYIVPRLVGREWRYASLIKLHFWSSTYGVGLMVLMLFVGGIAQGSSLNDPSLAFSETTQSILPYLRGRSVSGLLLTIAHFVFAFHFGLMLFGLGRTASMPTFLNPQQEEAVKDHI